MDYFSSAPVGILLYNISQSSKQVHLRPFHIMASLNFAHFLIIAFSLFFVAAAGAVTGPVVKAGYHPSGVLD
ncbi:hypothetical protein CJ030_MR0G028245 [Morella rubra]|uniref:Uncharacterized protein n=1 Tax=Morella rubra TaxID=262757 RepID=A0A6A1UGL2_9ROSI|nr:hypothetical protein CJ030_MR0G028245 [Morella rubra]